jgi:ribonuclease HII
MSPKSLQSPKSSPPHQIDLAQLPELNLKEVKISPAAPGKFLLDLTQLPELNLVDYQLVAGVDEVGRGALFGEVAAAAVILPREAIASLAQLGVRDSKKLSPKRRQELAIEIKSSALAWQIASATVAEIDEINILQASLLAMKRAIANLAVTPEICLVDGNQSIPDLPMPQQTLVQGDGRSIVIAAASILAKVWRDAQMIELASTYPQYHLAQNKGYGTAQHLAALREHGASPLHRQSFHLSGDRP